MKFQSLIQTLKTVQDTDTHIYALLDFTQLKTKQRTLPDNMVHAFIWASSQIKLTDAMLSPVLISLPKKSFRSGYMKLIPENLQWLPFHSLIVSSLSISELSQHLGRFSLCQTDFDEQILILRWADTRILPIMAAELETSDTAEFLRPILMWCYPDYSGHWHILHGQNQPYIKTHHLLKISQKSFNQMLNSSSIYASWNLFCSKLDDMDWDEQIRLCPQFLWAHFQQEYTQVDHDAPMFYINEFIEQTLAKLKTKQPEILSQPFPHLFDTPQK